MAASYSHQSQTRFSKTTIQPSIVVYTFTDIHIKEKRVHTCGLACKTEANVPAYFSQLGHSSQLSNHLPGYKTVFPED